MALTNTLSRGDHVLVLESGRFAIGWGEQAKMLGAKIEVPTVSGPVNLTIPKGTSSGQTFRLRGKGVKNATTGAKGDQFVLVKIVLPDEIDDGLAYYLTEWRQTHGYNPRR